MIRNVVSKIRRKPGLSINQRGQGLTEMAIMTPILLLFLLGLVEVGAALHSYLTVVNASREGTRYGVKVASARSGFGGDEVTDEIIAGWTLSAGNTLPIITEEEGGDFAIDGQKATIIVTHLRKTFSRSTGYSYEVLSQYSIGEDRPSMITEEWLAEATQRANKDMSLLAGLPNETAEDLAVEVIYEHPQLTGIFSIGRFVPDPIPLHSLTVMRINGSSIPACDAYPIAVHKDSIEGVSEGQSIGDIYNGSGAGNFGWLRWPADPSAGNEGYLVDSLTDPSLSLTDFSNAQDPSDTWLSTGDSVWGNTGLSNSTDVRAALDDLEGKRIRLLIWDTASGSGINGYYHIIGFAWFKITDYELPGQDRITATFWGWDTSCTAQTD